MPQDPTQVDPSIVALMHGLKSNEGAGGDYNKLGDKNAAGLYTAAGIGQWSNQIKGVPQPLKPGQIPSNFASDAQTYGLNPNDFSAENQNKVMATRLIAEKKQGLTPEQILSKWNSGNPNAYLTETKTKQGSVGAYNVASYVKNGMAAAQQFAQSNGSNGNINTANASGSSGAPESLLHKAGDVVGSVGNFLFPAVKDIYHDVTGQNTGANQKTALQQAGDVGMSVLPFIPGLGEVGEAAKGVDLAAEGASKFVPGIVSKLAGSTVARNAAVGYGAGVASNLQQGKGIGESLTPGINTIGGAALGAGGALAGKALGGILDSATGIPKNRIPVLSGISPKLYDEYAKVGAARAANEDNPSLLQNGIQHAQNAVETIKKNLSDTGKEIGAIKTSEGNTALQDVTPVIKSFAEKLRDRFGVDLNVTNLGKITLDKTPGRLKDVLSSGDESRIKSALGDLLSLRNSGNVRKASDVIDNLDNAISYGKKTYFGGTDPLNGFLKETRHDLNDVVGKTSPALAKIKTRAASLHDVLDEVESAGGTNFQRAGLLLKRTLSGDQGDVSNKVFDTIKKETGVDLKQHGVLIKHFTNAIGDNSEKSALQKMLEESANGNPTLTGLLLSGGKSALNATIANPVKQGRRIVQGKTGVLNSILRNGKGALTKSALELGRGASNLIGN